MAYFISENMDYFAYRCNHTMTSNYQYNIQEESWYDTVETEMVARILLACMQKMRLRSAGK